ncbi:MAG: hypothetical protein WAK93_12645 [Solirubrobacteraceae bacterium]
MTDDPVLAQLARANPEQHPRCDPADDQLLAAILDQPAIGPRRRRSPARILVPVLSAAVVIAVVFVFARAGGTHRTTGPATSAGTQRIVLRVVPDTAHVTAVGVRTEIAILREHLNALGVAPSASVRQIGRDEIAVVYPGAHPLDRATLERLFAIPQIAFVDWEDNVIAPDGRTVASQLPGGGAGVLSLSQGGRTGPGVAGGMRLYDAVRLASHQPARPLSSTLSRLEPQYFAFTKSGGYLAGPASTRGELNAPHRAVILVVPQGTVVVQAVDPTPIGAAQYQNSHARFFVLRDHLDVAAGQLRHVTASDHHGSSTLNLAFTPRGQRSFHQLTAAIARRGASLGESADPFLQHVAVIEDGTLLSVAQIDYRVYPEGFIDPATTGIPTGLPTPTTQRVALELTQGILPLALQVISR